MALIAYHGMWHTYVFKHDWCLDELTSIGLDALVASAQIPETKCCLLKHSTLLTNLLKEQLVYVKVNVKPKKLLILSICRTYSEGKI